MQTNTLYKEVLLDHFHHPRNKGDLDGADNPRRGSNPRCGDEIEVGLDVEAGHLHRVRFRGRGCSVCIASASLMTETVGGLETGAARVLADAVRDWLGSGDSGHAPPPAGLESLAAVRAYPARRRCVLLSWEALSDAIDDL